MTTRRQALALGLSLPAVGKVAEPRCAPALRWPAGIDRQRRADLGAPDQRDGVNTVSTVNETIDGSVFERWRRNGGYRPANLQTWAARHGVAVEDLADSVLASDPSRPLQQRSEDPPLAPATPPPDPAGASTAPGAPTTAR